MRHRIIAFLLAGVTALSLAACAQGGSGEGTATPSQSVPPSPSQSAAPSPSAAPAEAPDLQAFLESFADDETFSAEMEVTDDALEAWYPGLSDISVKQQLIYTPMISAVAFEIALVEVEDAGDVEKVEEIFQARIDAQVGTPDAPGGAWYPASIQSWEEDSRIVTDGTCVMLIVWEKCDTAVDAFHALF